MHQRDEDVLIQGPGHTVALHSAAHTLVLDPDLDLDQDPDPGLTLIPLVVLAPVHAPMVGLIPAPLTLDVMDAVMGAHGQGPALAQGLMGIAVLELHGLPPHTGEVVGKEQKERDPTGPGHGLALLAATGAAVLVDENHLLESSRLTN